jgi:hypothetical protein
LGVYFKEKNVTLKILKTGRCRRRRRFVAPRPVATSSHLVKTNIYPPGNSSTFDHHMLLLPIETSGRSMYSSATISSISSRGGAPDPNLLYSRQLTDDDTSYAGHIKVVICQIVVLK